MVIRRENWVSAIRIAGLVWSFSKIAACWPFAVTNLDDAPVDTAGDLPGSLRQAIFDANQNPGADVIEFSSILTGNIALTEGELVITDELTVKGPGSEVLTIDAQQLSRILNITATSGDFAIEGLQLTGGRSTGSSGGGAIRSMTLDQMLIDNCTISGNSTLGDYAFGGGVFAAGDVTITDSNVLENSTSGRGANGGGVYAAENVTVMNSNVMDNDALGYAGLGGGLGAGEDVTVTNSTVSRNHATGDFASGAGVWGWNAVRITNSTITENYAVPEYSPFIYFINNSCGGVGGGIDEIVITNSIVEDNVAWGAGGGINGINEVTVSDSNISRNSSIQLSTEGGGISTRTLTLADSNVSGNYSQGLGGGAAAIRATVTNSTITNNLTTGIGAGGGGLRVQDDLTLIDSSVTGNATLGDFSWGGGIQVLLSATLINSTVSQNSTYGERSPGGGVASYDLTLIDSTVSGNRTRLSEGGGISAGNTLSGRGRLRLTNSTVSGNSTLGSYSDGGGVHVRGDVTLERSTVTDNHAFDASGRGMWIQHYSDADPPTIMASIVANNTDGGDNPDLWLGTPMPLVEYSLIGDNAGTALGEAQAGDANGNLIGSSAGGGAMDPLLGPLADNGGQTLTHALLPGSPAIDVGDPSAMAGVGDTPQFDQRGAPFIRVLGDRIDMGAYELRPETAEDGDFNDDGLYDCLDIDQLVAEITAGSNNPAFDMTGDGLVNLADRDAWLAEAVEVNLGPGKFYLLGDANLDGIVDGLDFIIWNTNKFAVLTVIPGWCQGNFNADAFVDGLDFIEWNENKFQMSDGPSFITMPPFPIDRLEPASVGFLHAVQSRAAPTTVNDEPRAPATFQAPAFVARDVNAVFARLPRFAQSDGSPSNADGFPDDLMNAKTANMVGDFS